MKYLHIVIDHKNRTYSVNDGLPAVEENHGISENTLNGYFSRKKVNYDKDGVIILRAKEKNKVYKIDEDLDSQ